MAESLDILVLGGGPDREREVSVRSAAAVANALRSKGHQVTESDISPQDTSALDKSYDVVFPVLHGSFGEGGPLQDILEARGIPYVGSGPQAARKAMNKVLAKQEVKQQGVVTPAFEIVTPDHPVDLRPPVVIKPINEGSSVDTFICMNESNLAACRSDIGNRYERLLVEQFVEGTEVTVGILGDRALPVIQIVPGDGFYDYESKYNRDDTEYLFDIDLPLSVLESLQTSALRAHQTLGCRHLSRVDFIVDKDHQPWFLEVNTMPGFTDHSLLPKAAHQAGIPMAELCHRLVAAAVGAMVC